MRFDILCRPYRKEKRPFVAVSSFKEIGTSISVHFKDAIDPEYGFSEISICRSKLSTDIREHLSKLTTLLYCQGNAIASNCSGKVLCMLMENLELSFIPKSLLGIACALVFNYSMERTI